MPSPPPTPLERRILILYATETGNAYDIAQSLSRIAKRHRYDAYLASVDEYPIEDFINEPLVIFVVSTTGSGSEPRSMTQMWSMLLRADLPDDLLEGMDYAVFGLGDTAYEKFCWAAKKLDRRLESLGARRICERGDGDDQHELGLEGAFDPWTNKLFEVLDEEYPLPAGVDVIPAEGLRESRITISPVSGKAPTVSELDSRHWATLKINQRITAPDWYQDVRHIEFVLDEPLEYRPGDIAVIYPEAPEEDVNELLNRMGWANEAEEEIQLNVRPGEQPLPKNVPHRTTLREIFTKYLDINAVPRRSFFDLLRYFTPDELEREKLEEFCTPEGQQDLCDYCQRVRRTIREVLVEFRHVSVPKGYIFDLFPPLRPRQFSIASSSKSHPKEIHTCVAIVNYKTKLKIPRKGVCTRYLVTLAEGARVGIGLERGFIRPPKDISTPIICVGPGTGIAPMRALIEERELEGAKDNTLYFGCRSRTKDQHYGSEWEERERAGTLRYRLSCSRDGEDGKARVYVQHLMEEDAESIWDVLNNKKGSLYISGSSNKMPVAVKQAAEHAAVTVGGLSEEEAKRFVMRLEREGRLFEECWS
ncbi:hypothetical protein M422DRAFT_221404 [Sphaerobolus stellatus SS14]|nr:hypothetical protein M422DRAFT_221404 [Sphaerobolus stellatus SS14]